VASKTISVSASHTPRREAGFAEGSGPGEATRAAGRCVAGTSRTREQRGQRTWRADADGGTANC
jgi:hypothetical protein